MVIPISKSAPSPSGPRSTWAVWTSSPHRMMFLPGALQLVAALLLVAWEVGGRSLGFWATPAWTVSPAWSHAYLMLFGLFPWFVFGFAMTAIPKWTNVRLARGAWLACALPMIAGLVLFYAGLVVARELVVAGAILQLAGWLAGSVALARIVFAGERRDTHAISIVVLLFVGGLAAAFFLVALASLDADAIALAVNAGLWLFLLPIFLVVSHRMVPFFSSRVLSNYAIYQPSFSLPFLGVACVTHHLLETASLPGWTWVADAPMAAWVGWLAWKWGLTKSFRVRLLAMLHIALSVLAVSFAFSAVASLVTLAGHPGLFGRGPLHLLAVGYIAATMLGMVSRVSLGHSGRSLEADTWTWRGFLALIAVGVARAVADFAPLAGAPRAALLALSALAWIVIVASWAARFVPLYLTPRRDGRIG